MACDNGLIVALDQGTDSSRAVRYSATGAVERSASRPLAARFPNDGWVEQDPEEIWETQREALDEAVRGAPAGSIRAIGITNQRETTIVWDRQTGRALAPAIVWQCRRSEAICKRVRSAAVAERLKRITGLVIDPYFSASKILWLIENEPAVRDAAESGRGVFGTVDSWLLYKLTGGEIFATEPSNASRTMLYSLESAGWDDELLAVFGIARRHVAELKPSAGFFGATDLSGARVPITGILGDQQAALFGHHCHEPGESKCTFGTGAFLLANTGAEARNSAGGLLRTAAWALGSATSLTFALEGSIFIAGALIQWLRDGLGLLTSAPESEQVAASVPTSGGVVIVPALVGLGAPHWCGDARGAILNATRDTKRPQIVRAALEAVAHQVADLLELDELHDVPVLHVDGGMTANALFCSLLADITERPVTRAATTEVTAFGAAAIAALGAGIYSDLPSLRSSFTASDEPLEVIPPRADPARLATERAAWKRAVRTVINHAASPEISA